MLSNSRTSTTCSECHEEPAGSMLRCRRCKRAPICQQCAYNHLDHVLEPIGTLEPAAFVDPTPPTTPADARKARIMAAAERFVLAKGGR